MKEFSVGLVMTLTAVAGAMPAQAEVGPENSAVPDGNLAQLKVVEAATLAQVKAIAQQTQSTPEAIPSLEFSSTPLPARAVALAQVSVPSDDLLPPQVRHRLGRPTPPTPAAAPIATQLTPAAIGSSIAAVAPAPPVPALIPTPTAPEAMAIAKIAPVAVVAAPLTAPTAQFSRSTKSSIPAIAPADSITTTPIAMPPSRSTAIAAAPQFEAPPQPSLPDPAVVPLVQPTTGLDAEMAEKLRRLEERQQELEAELKTLRQQVANPTTPSTPVAIVIPEMEPQALTVSAEALFFRPTTSNSLDFAIIDPGTALATSGDLATANYSDGTALRFGLNYRLPQSPWDIDGSYLIFNTTGSAQADRPATGFLFSTLSHPRQNESADTASAQSSLDLNSFTVDTGYRFQLSQGLGVRLFAGLQVANTQQSLGVDYNGRDYTNGRIDLESKFSGWGPRLGAELRASLGSGFSVFGRGSGAILFGQSSARFTETDNNGTDVIADLARDRTRTVPVLNLAVGLDWAAALSTNSKFNLSLGYEFQQWFNVSDNIRFVNAASPAVFAENAGSLSLQGFFVRGGLSFSF